MICNTRKKSSEYMAWGNMKQRCYNPKATGYKNYGAKGVVVCEKWKDNFRAFLEDMGQKPMAGFEIDRIDGNGIYEPSNCRWVSKTDNLRNKSCVKLSLAKAEAIRIEYAQGGITETELGFKYQVSREAIAGVLHNRNWRKES